MISKKYDNLTIDLSSRVLTPNDYTFVDEPPDELFLNDLVICYSDTTNIKVVPLDLMKRYTILHDKNIVNDKLFSLIVCPYTLMSCNYEYNQSSYSKNNLPNISVTNFIHNGTIVLRYKLQNDSDEILFDMFDEQPDFFTRYDVQIKTLKNVFTDHIHTLYLQLEKNVIKCKNILNDTYYTNTQIIYSQENLNLNLIHPKTLVYVIIYISSKTNKPKSTIIIGADANSQKSSGFDTNISKFTKYFEKNKRSIDNKMGYVLPTFWFATRIFFKNSPIIFLSGIFK